MLKQLRAEGLKTKRLFIRKTLWFFPFLVCLLALLLMQGGFFQIGSYNWWYTMFLPACLALWCGALIFADQKQHFQNLLLLPIPPVKTWKSKITIGFLGLLGSNIVLWAFVTAGGFVFERQFPPMTGLYASLVLTLVFSWQIPLLLFGAIKIGGAATFLIAVLSNALISGQSIAGGPFWLIPTAIPSRLMAAILHVNPNGIPLEGGSPLYDTGVILPGVLICLALFALTTILTSLWFQKGVYQA